MPSTLWQYIIGGFLILHGIGHTAGFWVPGTSSILTNIFGGTTARIIAITLWIIAAIGFIAAGLGVLGVPIFQEWWRTLAISASAVSILAAVVYWGSSLFGALLADIVILVALLIFRWPPVSLVGS